MNWARGLVGTSLQKKTLANIAADEETFRECQMAIESHTELLSRYVVDLVLHWKQNARE